MFWPFTVRRNCSSDFKKCANSWPQPQISKVFLDPKRASKIKTVLHIFDYFFQLIFMLTPLTSAAKSNEKFVNQKFCNTVLILDALQKKEIQVIYNSHYGNGALAMFTFQYYLKLKGKHCRKSHCRNGVCRSLGVEGQINFGNKIPFSSFLQ